MISGRFLQSEAEEMRYFDLRNKKRGRGGKRFQPHEEGLKVTPPTVRVLPASPKECGHQSKTIVCVASGFYPDHVSFSWTDKEGEVSSGVATDSEAVLEEGKTYMMSSRLRVSAEEWNNPDNEFTCTVHFFDGDKTVPYSASVKGIEAERKTITRDKYLKVTQSAKLTYSVFIVKSCFYGAFVAFLLLKFQGAKQKN
uniref:Ig-like domain-containing protein n=1 Tax=Labrus bergylta TaxID=56723 RepID=A0A3Q3FHV1_9LABR